MILYVNRKSIFVMLHVYWCVFHCGDGNASDATDSDEDDKLREALLLVNILKSEYSRVLQDNDILRTGPSNVAELSTCPTTKGTDVNETTTIPLPQATPLTPIVTNVAIDNPSKDQPGLPLYRPNRRYYNNGKYAPRYARRFMKIPMDYYYHGPEEYRRFNYEDPFGAHPNDTLKPPAITSDTTTISTSTTPSTTQSEAQITTTTTSTPISTEASRHTTTILTSEPTPAAQSSEEGIRQLHLMLTVPHAEVTSTVDPVMSQVASELIYEFKTERSSLQAKYIKLVKLPKPTFTLGVTGSWWRRSKLARTTYRVHLSGSTKFPVPYPENHAFCYTNPENALCRTLIK